MVAARGTDKTETDSLIVPQKGIDHLIQSGIVYLSGGDITEDDWVE